MTYLNNWKVHLIVKINNHEDAVEQCALQVNKKDLSVVGFRQLVEGLESCA